MTGAPPGQAASALSPAMILAVVFFTCISSTIQDHPRLFGHWPSNPQPPKTIPQYSWPSKCFKTPACDSDYPYRTIDGTCNNLKVSSLGAANTTMSRLLPARYSDDKGGLPVSVNGKPLPLARLLRTTLMPNKAVPDNINTLAVMTWGQFLTHDVTLIGLKGVTGCCTNDGKMVTDKEVPADCLVIPIPEDDEFFRQFAQNCFALSRSETINARGCDTTPIQQISLQTSFLDLSMVYGRNKDESNLLRSFVRGRLRTQEDDDGREFLPNVVNATASCPFASSATDPCFKAGDPRVNQQPPLTALHTIMLREHNLLSDQLFLLNPHWTDEKIFQEARAILIAQYQHIIYAHYLPIILGEDNAAFYKLTPTTLGYGFGYDEEVNPGTMNMFATAAFRSLHSLIPSHFDLPMDVGQCPLRSMPLADVMNRPDLLVKDENYDDFLRGLTRQASFKMGPFHTDEITNLLFRPPTRPFGIDLISLDIMRGRDHGLPPYNAVRHACGLTKASDFSDFGDTMSKESWTKLQQAYSHVDDVDLYVGGMMEDLVPGTLVGRVFQCIIAEQFRRWKTGDRKFYEYGGMPGSFRLDQLEEIKKTSLSLLICRNSDRLKKIPKDAFSLPSSRNAMVKCKTIPTLNLRLWQEPKE